jgi:hypothetical protein
LGVQGEGRFLALGVLGCFWGNETCIVYVQGRMEKIQDSAGLLYTRGGR